MAYIVLHKYSVTSRLVQLHDDKGLFIYAEAIFYAIKL